MIIYQCYQDAIVIAKSLKDCVNDILWALLSRSSSFFSPGPPTFGLQAMPTAAAVAAAAATAKIQALDAVASNLGLVRNSLLTKLEVSAKSLEVCC